MEGVCCAKSNEGRAIEVEKAKIRVRLEGGKIRDVQRVPEHYTVQVLDYDVSKYDAAELSRDERQKSCRITEWSSKRRGT